MGFLRRAQLNMQARWIIARLADRPLGRPGLSRARAAEGEAPPGRDLAPLLPPRRTRTGRERPAGRKHLRTLSRRSARLTKLGLTPPRAARPRDRARPRLRRRHALARRLRDARRRPEARLEHADRGGLHEPGPAPDERDVPVHLPALLPRPADPRDPRRVLEGAARPPRGRLGRRSRLRRRLHRHRPDGTAARRGRARRRLLAHRPERAHLLQHPARRERRGAHRLRQRVRRHALGDAARAGSTARRSTSTS